MSSEYLPKIFRECFSYYVQRIFTRNIPRIFPEHCHTDTNIRSGNVQQIFTKNIQGMFFVNIRWTLPLRIFVNIRISVAMFREYSRNISRKYSLDITPANIQGIRTAGSGLELSCCCSLLHVVRRGERYSLVVTSALLYAKIRGSTQARAEIWIEF